MREGILYTANKWNQAAFMPKEPEVEETKFFSSSFDTSEEKKKDDDKLYTVNKFNSKKFNSKKENVFALGDQMYNANATKLALEQFGETMDSTDAGGRAYLTDRYLNGTTKADGNNNLFGISKAANPFSKVNLSASFGKDALKGAAGGLMSAGLGAVGSIGNKLAYNALSGGLSSGAGSAIAGIGNTVGGALSAIPGVGTLAGPAVQIASGIVGGGINALVGTSVDQAKLDAAKKGTSTLQSFTSTSTTFDDISGPVAQANVQDAYKSGLLNRGWAKKRNEEIKRQRAEAASFASRGITNNISNLADDQINNALANYSAFGGYLTIHNRKRRKIKNR